MITSFKIDDDLKGRIKSQLSGTQTVSQFAFDATQEKVTRMEVRNKIARLKLFKKDLTSFKPLILAILKEEGLIDG